ncbi:MAG: hypothetical protein AB7T37_17095 [Dehalococcoidia bacterium]
MPADLTSIPDDERDDFAKRLGVFGLDASAVNEPLNLQRNGRIELAHGGGRDSFVKPVVVHVRDFDDLNKMIGVDDRVFEKAPQRVPLPQRLEFSTTPNGPGVYAAPGMPGANRLHESIADLDVRELDEDNLVSIRAAARAYLRGNSRVVASYKPIIEAVIGTIELPVWAFVKIRVPSGSTLSLGPGINSLVAWEVEVEQGGRIVSKGHLTISCTRFRKPSPVVGPITGFHDFAVARRTIFG